MNTKAGKPASVKPIIMLLALALSLAVMLGIGLAYPNSSTATAATPGSGSPQSSFMPDTTCELAWRDVPSPNVGYLYGVAASSSNNVTRGQASKIVANTFLPNCQTPSR